MSDLRFTVLIGAASASQRLRDFAFYALSRDRAARCARWTAEDGCPHIKKEAAPHEICGAALLKGELLRGYSDVIQIHIRQIAEAVSVSVEIDADALALVRGQIIRHRRP